MLSMAFLIFSGFAQAASFDCSLASSKIEQQICNNAEINELDATLGRTYKKVSKDNDVRQSQRDWLRNVRNVATNDAIMIAVYKQRISELEMKISESELKHENKPSLEPDATVKAAVASPIVEPEKVKNNKEAVHNIYAKNSLFLASISLCEKDGLVYDTELTKNKLIAEAKEELGAEYSAETMRNYYNRAVRKISEVKSLTSGNGFYEYCQPYANSVNEINVRESTDLDF
jgi:uncharacterized protein